MPQSAKRMKIIFKKGSRVGLPRGSWTTDAKGNMIAMLTEQELAVVKGLNMDIPKKARDEGYKAAIKLGGL